MPTREGRALIEVTAAAKAQLDMFARVSKRTRVEVASLAILQYIDLEHFRKLAEIAQEGEAARRAVAAGDGAKLVKALPRDGLEAELGLVAANRAERRRQKKLAERIADW